MSSHRLRLFAAVALLATGGALAGEVADASVARILGVPGVTHAPSKMLALDLEYKDQAGRRMFTLRVSEPSIYDAWKTAAKKSVALSGLGADAFAEPNLKRVCARTATTAACANALLPSSDTKPTQEQLVEIVRAAL
ncbi:MAG: hypothetical protein QM722_22645 [Piscinibacter sp.]